MLNKFDRIHRNGIEEIYDYVYGYFLLKGMITASYETMKDSFDGYHTGNACASFVV